MVPNTAPRSLRPPFLLGGQAHPEPHLCAATSQPPEAASSLYPASAFLLDPCPGADRGGPLVRPPPLRLPAHLGTHGGGADWALFVTTFTVTNQGLRHLQRVSLLTSACEAPVPSASRPRPASPEAPGHVRPSAAPQAHAASSSGPACLQGPPNHNSILPAPPTPFTLQSGGGWPGPLGVRGSSLALRAGPRGHGAHRPELCLRDPFSH